MRVAPFALTSSLTLLLTPAVHAEVTPPRVISPPGLAVQEHAVGAGGGRTAVLMTGLRGTGRTMRGAVYARLGRSSTTLGPSIQLAARRGETPSVSVGADGTAVAAWVETGVGVRVAIAAPGRAFGAARTVRPDESGGKADRPFRIGGVVVTPAGRAALVWRTGGTVQVAVAPALGRFPRATAIGVARQHDPSIALGTSGTVALGWLDTPRDPVPGGPAPGPAVVQATMLREGSSTFAPPTSLGALGYWPAGVLTGGGPGGAIVGWWENGALRASQLGVSDGFGAAVTAPGSTVDGANTLATDASGAMISTARTVTYAGGDDLETVTSAAVLAGVAEAGKPFGPLQQLSTSGWIAEWPRVAAMPDRTFVAWEERRGTSQMRIRSAYRRPSGGWRILNALRVTFPRDGRGVAVRVSGDAHQAPITWISYQGVRDPSIGGRLTMAEYRP